MEDLFDAVIVGAGTGGAVFAITAARSGLDVCLIDSKPKEDIGNKVCGDIVWKRYFDILKKRIGIDHPDDGELNQIVSGLKIVSPDKKTSIQVGDNHYMINRHMFGQRLIEKAIDEGATLLDSLRVTAPLIKDNTVVGVAVKDSERTKVCGKIIIDASGALPVLRDKVVLSGSFLENVIDKRDTAIAYREIRELKHDVPDKDFARIYLSDKNVPGGYTWCFPDGDNRVNVGVGAMITSDNANMKSAFLERIAKNPLFSNSRVVMKGGGILPTRRPLGSMVANGFMCVGDAGCQVNPISGAGIEFSMDGGYLAAITAIDAIANNDVSQEMLWDYNKNYMDAHGTAQTMLGIFKILLHSCDDNDLNFGMKNLVDEKSVMMINSGKDVKMTRASKAKILLRGMKNAGLLNRFTKVAKNMQIVKELCENYPQPDGFIQWEKMIRGIYSDTRIISRVIQ